MPREGGALWLWHFQVIFTFLFLKKKEMQGKTTRTKTTTFNDTKLLINKSSIIVISLFLKGLLLQGTSILLYTYKKYQCLLATFRHKNTTFCITLRAFSESVSLSWLPGFSVTLPNNKGNQNYAIGHWRRQYSKRKDSIRMRYMDYL